MTINELLNAFKDIDFQANRMLKIEHLPNFTLIDKTANLLTFGLTKKRKIKKKTDSYYRLEILSRKISFQHVETHLKEN